MGFLHPGSAHLGRGHHLAAAVRSAGAVVVLAVLDILLEGLLALDLLLNILISLQDLIVLHLAQLKTLVHARLQLLFKCIHLVLLFLHKLSLRSKDLLVARLHIVLAFRLLELVCTHLNLVRVLIVLLFRQVGLDAS